MKKASLFIAFFCLSLAGFSQQDYQFSQFMHNKLLPNPGVAGANNGICATLIGRQQWAQFDGNPESVVFSAHGTVKPIFGGVGLSVVADRLGQESTVAAKLSYAFRTDKIGPGNLGIGIGLGFINKSIGQDWRSTDNFQQDVVIPDNGASDIGFDMDLGIYYDIEDKLYFGISTTHLTQTSIEDQAENPGVGVADDLLSYTVARHYWIMAGYNYDLNAEWQLQPNMLIKTDLNSAQVDLNLTAMYNKLLWGGVSYRYQDAIIPMVGINYGMPGSGLTGGTLKFGYSYDVTTSLIRQHSAGSHEIMLNYCFSIEIPPKLTKHKTVRFL
ncbi:MAG: type IX secretion system membrane protein PorP/SprF [Salibacteraceae bacterium]